MNINQKGIFEAVCLVWFYSRWHLEPTCSTANNVDGWWLYLVTPRLSAIKNYMFTLLIAPHFVIMGIKAQNIFALLFRLYKKYVHRMILLLLSFSE
jgi:hypothetical protein